MREAADDLVLKYAKFLAPEPQRESPTEKLPPA